MSKHKKIYDATKCAWKQMSKHKKIYDDANSVLKRMSEHKKSTMMMPLVCVKTNV